MMWGISLLWVAPSAEHLRIKLYIYISLCSVIAELLFVHVRHVPVRFDPACLVANASLPLSNILN